LGANALASAIREDLLSAEGVRRVVLSRRTTAILSPGSPATHLYFLESGLVKLERLCDNSREVLIAVLASGDVFGEQAILNDGVLTCSAHVLEPGVAFCIPTETFNRHCERRPELWRLTVQYLLQRKEKLEKKIEHLCHSDVRERLIFYLLELSRLTPAHEAAGHILHISQNELASMVGATRETTSTTLNSLARQGLLSLGHRMIMIPSVELLREAATPPVAVKATAAAGPQM
jgi:CRP/FNR family transcriptional regulator